MVRVLTWPFRPLVVLVSQVPKLCWLRLRALPRWLSTLCISLMRGNSASSPVLCAVVNLACCLVSKSANLETISAIRRSSWVEVRVDRSTRDAVTSCNFRDGDGDGDAVAMVLDLS